MGLCGIVCVGNMSTLTKRTVRKKHTHTFQFVGGLWKGNLISRIKNYPSHVFLKFSAFYLLFTHFINVVDIYIGAWFSCFKFGLFL